MASEQSKKMIVRVSDYKKVFSTDQGKRVLNDLCKVAMIFESTHVPNDPYSSAKNEGARDCVLRILKLLKYDLKSLIEQIEKGEKEYERDQQRNY